MELSGAAATPQKADNRSHLCAGGERASGGDVANSNPWPVGSQNRESVIASNPIVASHQFVALQFSLRQPKIHTHLTVHRGGRGQVLLCLLPRARAPEELAETEVAVGDARSHPTRLSEPRCLAVMKEPRLAAEFCDL
jgi:hypothetical protein